MGSYGMSGLVSIAESLFFSLDLTSLPEARAAASASTYAAYRDRMTTSFSFSAALQRSNTSSSNENLTSWGQSQC